jgi:queuine tRNA-ribosyltransferase
MFGKSMRFELLQKDTESQARRGRLHTQRSVVETPVFMPVGTLACVKGLDAGDMHNLGARIMLANAYHLMLRPGAELVFKMGGVQKFMGYGGSVLTDSGGFQVFSLDGLRRVTDAGVDFRSHVDGSLHHVSPERLVQVQECLGSDVAMVLDECPPAQAERAVVEQALRRTTAWAQRCSEARTREDMAWFGIVQGALFEDLRAAHAETMRAFPFEGFAIGGVSVGEPPEEIERIVSFTAPLLPENKPRYLMGVGTPQDLIRGVASGVDMFDCVMPTRNARNGQLFTRTGKIVIKNAAHRESTLPVDEGCTCYTCQHYTRAYLRHLYVAKEITYARLATLHNVTFYLNLMQRIRTALDEGCFNPHAMLAELEG